MKKHELLKYFDDELMEKLFGFCYVRTNDSYEAEELCSDIIFALLSAANNDGEIAEIYPFIWRVARNVYADFVRKRSTHRKRVYSGDSDEIFSLIADEEDEDNSQELLSAVYRRIAFLTKAYRDVMIMYYIDGLSTAQITKVQKISETAVRQRLFSARQKIKSEVNTMEQTNKRPVGLEKIDFHMWGTGNPTWGDPLNAIWGRMFSKHIIWLCRNKAMSASEIAEQLNVPTLYVEEELEILTKGANGEYGFIRRTDGGKYIINFVLLDKQTMNEASALYERYLPKVSEIICKFIEEHREEYLSFPYLNKKVDMNLILWQQVKYMSEAFANNVQRILSKQFFADVV